MTKGSASAGSGQWVQGDRNIQISQVAGSTIQVTINERIWHIPLEPAVAPVGPNVTSPARLVKARSGFLPYVDRGGHLDALSAWIGASDPFAICLIGGPGGTGKTRLGVELCERTTNQAKWLSGLLPPAEKIDPAGLRDLLDAPNPRLVVIDYAETRIEQLEVILPALQQTATEQHPIRVLLLVRKAPLRSDDWTEALRRTSSDWLETVLDDATVRVMEHTVLLPEERINLFNTAATALADRTEHTTDLDTVTVPVLALPAYGRPLFIVMAAYLAVNSPENLPSTRDGLLEGLIRHEDRYWASHAVGLNMSESLRRRVVALATLAGAGDINDAVLMLRHLPELSDATSERCHELARWAHELYETGPSWWNPLEPDLLGEYLLSTELGELPAVLAGALNRSPSARLNQPLDILTRAAAYDSDLAAAVGPILSDALERLCRTAAKQIAKGKNLTQILGAPTVAGALERALSVINIDPARLPQALNSLPRRPDVILNGLALTINEQWIHELRTQTTANPAALATSLNTLANRLNGARRREEALLAIEEAVELRRGLAAASPADFTSDLGRSLNNLAVISSGTGRREEALNAVEEALELYRGLVATNPAAFTRDLARSLNTLSNSLGDVGRSKEALAAIEEAVGMYRSLIAANPTTFTPQLARSLHTLSNSLSVVGRAEEALAAIEEAVDIHRGLIAANPTTFTPHLAGSLNSLASRLNSVDRRQEALAAIEEAVKLYRGLSEANPAAFTPDLAISLDNLSNHLANAGRHQECLTASKEAVQLRRGLTEASPTSPCGR